MNTEYLNNFEEKLQQELLHLCTNYGMLDSTLLAADDIDNRWHDLAPEYVADAVGQIRDYPVVSVAWAAYLGWESLLDGMKTGNITHRSAISRITVSKVSMIWTNTSYAICCSYRSTAKKRVSWKTLSAAADKLQ